MAQESAPRVRASGPPGYWGHALAPAVRIETVARGCYSTSGIAASCASQAFASPSLGAR